MERSCVWNLWTSKREEGMPLKLCIFSINALLSWQCVSWTGKQTHWIKWGSLIPGSAQYRVNFLQSTGRGVARTPVLLDNTSGHCQAGREGLTSEEKVPYGGASVTHGAVWVMLVLPGGRGLVTWLQLDWALHSLFSTLLLSIFLFLPFVFLSHWHFQ